MKKRMTKAQKEALEKAKLRRRVADVATGAAGYEFDAYTHVATAIFLDRYVPALRVLFGTDNNKWLFQIEHIRHYDNIDSATDFLFSNGVRA